MIFDSQNLESVLKEYSMRVEAEVERQITKLLKETMENHRAKIVSEVKDIIMSQEIITLDEVN
ncbi:hypothetical protein UFOVP610_24 [uncultured Caudovirales phage]|uniref:Uncharacterized protein n=1 Tax=uncultured Caudovirales phage TaxID=2100421 RepID=A0A6J5N3W9_9CAUD|nr:hypothetical protein UFOVP610_24 [uncultured Caudovirales phage]